MLSVNRADRRRAGGVRNNGVGCPYCGGRVGLPSLSSAPPSGWAAGASFALAFRGRARLFAVRFQFRKKMDADIVVHRGTAAITDGVIHNVEVGPGKGLCHMACNVRV